MGAGVAAGACTSEGRRRRAKPRHHTPEAARQAHALETLREPSYQSSETQPVHVLETIISQQRQVCEGMRLGDMIEAGATVS